MLFDKVNQRFSVVRTRQLTQALFAAGVLALCVAASAGVSAQTDFVPESKEGDLATRWKVNDADPRTSIPPLEDRNKDPLEFGYWLQDMLARAEDGFTQGDWKRTIKYYSVLSETLPEVPASFSKLCHAYRELGDSPNAIMMCSRVMSMPGARVVDHLNYLQALVDKPDFTAEDKVAAEASLKHLREHARLYPQALPGHEPAAMTAEQEQLYRSMTAEEKTKDPKKWLELEASRKIRAAAGEAEPEKAAGAMHLPTQIEIFNCRIGARLGDAPRLRDCTQALLRYEFPRHLVFPFRWARAIAEGDRVESEAMLLEAQQYGLKGEPLEAMKRDHERAFNIQSAATTRPANGWVLPVGVAAALALALIAAFLMRRTRVAAQS